MLKCKICGFKETDKERMIGIFSNGASFFGTHGKMVALYGCPKCNTVIFTDNEKYINERKQEYKNRMRNR